MNQSTRFQLRLTPAQKDKLLAQASRSNTSAANVIRDYIELGKHQPVLSINLIQWSKLGPLLANLNQLVRLANKGEIDAALLPTIEAVKTELLAIRNDLVTKEASRS